LAVAGPSKLPFGEDTSTDPVMDRVAAAAAIDAFLRALGRDPDREPELKSTGARVASAYCDELLAGYAVDVDELLSQSVFDGRSEIVIVRDIPTVTTCPHHLMPSSGKATVAYGPSGRLLGVGTVARLVETFARRLVVQEQIGELVVDALQKHLAPRWVACRIVLEHACMTARGERASGSLVETVARAGQVDEAVLYAILGVGR